jgi:hypothetical protein
MELSPLLAFSYNVLITYFLKLPNAIAIKMASNFSGALQLTDLNDFITPSQVVFKHLILYI